MVLTGQLSGMICFTGSSKYSFGVVAHEFHFVKLAFGGDGICELCGVEETLPRAKTTESALFSQ